MSDNSTPLIRLAKVCAVDVALRDLLRAQVESAMKAGYDVTCFCSNGEVVPKLREQGWQIETLTILRWINPFKDLHTLWRLWRSFRKHRIHIIHTHTPKAAFLAQLAGKLAGVPIRINTVHGLYYLAFDRGFKRQVFKYLELLACRLATFTLSQSAEDVTMMQSERIVANSRLEWLGNGIDLKHFTPNRFPVDECQRVRNEFDIPENAYVIGIIARMVNEKGFHELFQAISKLREQGVNAYLVHIGYVDRSRGDEVTPERAEDYGINDACRFLGHRDDIPRLMRGMNVFCLPSYREGYPRSVIEASAMGLPSVVTDIRGCREAVIEGVNGLLVPPRTVTPLVAALKRLYDNLTLREQMAKRSIEHAAEHFDEQRVIKHVLGVYDRELCRIGLR